MQIGCRPKPMTEPVFSEISTRLICGDAARTGIYKNLPCKPNIGLYQSPHPATGGKMLQLGQSGVVFRRVKGSTHPDAIPQTKKAPENRSFFLRCQTVSDYLKSEFGAQERTRTSTPVRALAPEASASTSSATWAVRGAFKRRAGPCQSQGATFFDQTQAALHTRLTKL